MMKNRRVLFVMVAQLVSMVLTAGNATDQQGFVIVSADDRTQPILGYSDQGTLDISNLPVNAKAWLESYARQVQALDNGATATETGTLFQAIAPLLTCKWGSAVLSPFPHTSVSTL